MSRSRSVDLVAESFHDTQLLRFEELDGIPGFAHCITTRPWNMATHRGEFCERAAERRELVCRHLGLSFSNLTAADQVHSPHVLRVRAEDVGSGRMNRTTAMKFTDGLVCDLPDVPLIQFSADCPLVLAVDPRRGAVGTAHASWRGTVTSISAELIRMMQKQFGTRAADLVVAICPCAGPEEYEVGPEIQRIAEARLGDVAGFFPSRNGRLYFDMRGANVGQLVAGGVAPERILVARASTMSDRRFYSHRMDGPDTGRFAVIAGFRRG